VSGKGWLNQPYVYCPHCGTPLAQGEKFGRARRFCRYCGFIHFADPKVAVAALVTDGRRVLLVRRLAIPRIGYWALPAGYMDADEDPEEALVREVLEETGIRVRVSAFDRVAPLAGWKQRRGILLLFHAVAVEGEAAGGDDVSEARWFGVDEIPWHELAFDSTKELVRAWAGELD
jgi:ADP-ribose pyrophosphatase YjhB (NUDIX family)